MAKRIQEGSVAIVTGASSGIGRETALAFARRGIAVIAIARREERLKELVASLREHSEACSYVAGDLGIQSFAENAVASTVERHGRVDVLVNNAGIPKHKHVFHLTPGEAESVMRINFLSAVWTTLAVIPPMLAQGGGSIVNVSSFAAKVAPPREAIYAASKAAMNAFTEGLWTDLEGSGIHAAIVNPGPIDTEIWEKEDEPVGYDGPLYPPRVVVDAIFEAIEKGRYELTAPRRNPSLLAARALRLVAPGILRAAMARMEPVPPDLVSAARERALEGQRDT